MYSGGFYPYDTLEEYWAFWSRNIDLNRYQPAPMRMASAVSSSRSSRTRPSYERLLDSFIVFMLLLPH